jgi:hypothetical protein
MKNLKFNTLSDFSVHGVQWIAENVGHASMQRMGCINDKHTGLDLKNVQHYVATALQENFCVPVYLKENVCSSSKMVIIAMHWSSLWVYVSFYRNGPRIHAVVMYRKKKMDGVHILHIC